MKKIVSVITLIAVWIVLAGCGTEAEVTSGDYSASSEVRSTQTENLQTESNILETRTEDIKQDEPEADTNAPAQETASQKDTSLDNHVTDGVLMEEESAEDGSNVAEEESTLALESTPQPEQTQESEQSQEMPSVAESESQTSVDIPIGSGNYAINSNNGKIHIVGACAATGNGSNAMKRPVYFDAYEEAEAYSVQIAPSQKKRQCGNCW